MNKAPLVPPLKCQGIKTKLVRSIQSMAEQQNYERWVEPFCGSCVVAFNVQPKRALLCDTNIHIIRLYQDIQNGRLTASAANDFLSEEGEQLRVDGDKHYYAVRQRFNAVPNSLDFLFLNRSCFNGVMRFNRSGGFNVPFGHKPERFRRAYITKIVNQIKRIAEVSQQFDWSFEVADFRDTLARATEADLVYCDPPYAGRHTDYFNQWAEADEQTLARMLKNLTCHFIVSTWHSNKYRTNPLIESVWNEPRFHVHTRKHFYHVGSKEELRHEMLEALILDFQSEPMLETRRTTDQPPLFASL